MHCTDFGGCTVPFKDLETRKTRQQVYSKRWYEGNKPRVLARTQARKALGLREWNLYKSTQACLRCGVSHPAVLDFHHYVRKGKRSIAKLIKYGRFKDARREAEEKCVPLCSNCHRLLHWNESRTMGHEP